MSHQVRLTLRPPPNVDFVHGYPGIPPGADRPQAAVKGAIEIRVPPQGVRAKWVRIELRKVETLPGGGTTNTFYDYVGPTPLNLWQAPEGDYGMLRTGDFQFSIRIPESIPPSIALENRAGINYELVASVCVKGKKGFFRRSKSSVVSTTSQILIDKHELHSTWPIYTQPESRTLTTPEGVTLLVDRRSACFGPGDRIAVSATIKSDALHTIILRGFELILKESSVFRPGPFAQGKKSAPQAKVVVVSEAKFAVNATIYGGMGHKSDLSCGLSADHTTTTLNAARHIDVTYTIVVRALMGTGQPVVMELPVIVSNWQRHVSLEAVRRIGPSPGLSLLPPQHSGHANGAITRVDPLPRGGGTLPTSRQQPVLDVRSATVGVSSPMSMNKPLPADEFGYGVGYPSTNNTINTNNNTGVNGNANNTTLTKVKTHQSTGSRSSTEDYRSGVGGGSGMGGGGGVGTTPGKGGRPTSSRSNTQQQHRFTITNLGNGEIPEDVEREMKERLMGVQSGDRERERERERQGGERGQGGQRWPTAEEEKLRLYESARAKAERMQGGVAPPPARPITPPVLSPQPITPPRQPTPKATPKPKSPGGPWPSAEEEKMRLFNQAQAAVQRTHGVSGSPSPPPPAPSPPASLSHHRSNSNEYYNAGGSKAAALYSAAMASRNTAAASGNLPQTPPQLKIQTQPAVRSPPAGFVPQYPTAEQEKAALRRYEEAKRAVDRTQGGDGAPVAYDALYPEGGSSSQQQQQPREADLPPPFQESTSGIPAAHLSEKERMRREYEARDAAALLGRSDSANAPSVNGYSYPGGYVRYSESVPGYTSPSPPPMIDEAHLPPPFQPGAGPSQSQYANAMAEKEALRRKFEEQDKKAAAAVAAPQPPPPRVASPRAAGGRPALPRPTPQPPVAGGSSGVLTAAEEKALLRVRYAAEEKTQKSKPKPVYTNGLSHSPPRAGSSTAPPSPTGPMGTQGVPPPPPLAPRPPAEYIQETQEVDARISRYANSDEVPPFDELPVLPPVSLVPGLLSSQPQNGSRLPEIRPFTPFNPAFGEGLKAPPPPPPLPPKPAGE